MRSLDWLVSLQSSPDRQFAAIGSNGFYERGASPAIFDQQPVEACATVSACLDAYRVQWRRAMGRSRRGGRSTGFSVENHLQHWLFDASTGGCRDGLHVDRPNQNQGAEATLSFLLALHEMRVDRVEVTVHEALHRRSQCGIMSVARALRDPVPPARGATRF